jgi:hypothetical protein
VFLSGALAKAGTKPGTVANAAAAEAPASSERRDTISRFDMAVRLTVLLVARHSSSYAKMAL